MDNWLSSLREAFQSMSNVEEMIKIGGISVMTIIIFAETGLLFGFFLPGDSMIVFAGIYTAPAIEATAFKIDPWYLMLFLTGAAIIGNEVGRWLGEKFGERVEKWDDGWFYKKRYLETARAYYTQKGSASLVLARFQPIVRTFVPFVAGMGKMPRGRFFLWNVAGAFIWIGSLLLLGNIVGRTPLRNDPKIVITSVIIISFLPLIYKAGKLWLTSSSEPRT